MWNLRICDRVNELIVEDELAFGVEGDMTVPATFQTQSFSKDSTAKFGFWREVDEADTGLLEEVDEVDELVARLVLLSHAAEKNLVLAATFVEVVKKLCGPI